MSLTIITSMTEAIWRETGRQMAESTMEGWRAVTGERLHLYAEGFWPLHPLVRSMRLPEWVTAFKERHRNIAGARGMATGAYDFRFDAVKFCNKVAAIEDAMKRASTDYLVWLDADTVTHQPVTMEWLRPFLPREEALSWLDRDSMYPECGVLIFNRQSTEAHKAVAEWRRLYESRDVFALRETHDSFVLQHVVEKRGTPWRSLSGAARSTSHPAAQGPLAAVLDHRKGARKKMAHSPEHRVLGR